MWEEVDKHEDVPQARDTPPDTSCDVEVSGGGSPPSAKAPQTPLRLRQWW